MTYIYQTVSEDDLREAFRRMDRFTEFTVDGLNALFCYLQDYAEDNGSPLELDVIALCCEFTEVENLEEFNRVTCGKFETIEEIEDHTTVIRVNEEAFIYAAF